MKSELPLDILLVEDCNEDIDLAKEALDEKKIKNRLHIMKDGELAISYLKDKMHRQSGIPDLIVLDLNLPKKNGYEVLEDIQADQTLKMIPVIVLTTAELSGDDFKAYKIDPQMYVKKSIDFHEFAQLVKQFTQDGQAAFNESGGIGDLGLRFEDKPLKILLIEDNPADVDLVREILFMKEKSRWGIKNVQRLKDALDCLEKEKFDVITLDLFLPDSQGLATLAKIRKHKSQIPIVVVSGLNDEQMAVASLRQGAQDYLIKGQITADLFVRTIQYALERKQLEQFKDELLGYVNHELNNPLTIIKEGIAQVADGLLGEVNPKQKHYLDKSLHHIDRLIRITDDLLMSAKLEFGKFSLEKESFDLVKTVADVVSSFRVSVPAQVKLILKATPEHISIMADKNRVEQIFMNLIGNALKFTKEGSVHVELAAQSDGIQCCVTDTGPGISEKDIGKIFEKFERASQDGSEKIRGSGLGLHICKLLIELHGGSIGVESQEGVGTTFSFVLPQEGE